METTRDSIIHLRPEDYRVIGPQEFGKPGLVARESLGPLVEVQALGVLVTVHDSTFEAHKGIGHHPHQGMERLFYILEGAVDHDDALNHIQGHMGLGDLGILTEGRRGMIHSEWNNTDGQARTYIFVYPTDPTPATAAFDAIRDDEAPRVSHDGATTKQVVQRGESRLNGDFRELGDHTLAPASSTSFDLAPEEAGLLFVVEGQVAVDVGDGSAAEGVAAEHTVLLAPSDRPRTVRVQAHAEVPSRVLHAITGPGHGLFLR